MKRFLSLFLVLCAVSCSEPESKGQKITQQAAIEDSIQPQQEISLDSLWNNLAYEKGGCLTGGQRVVNDRFGNELCVLTSTISVTKADWSPFFSHPKEKLTTFLLDKLSDTTQTRIHTCPFFVATTGELAVYCLSNIHLKNWYDLSPFVSYQDRKPKNSIDGEQAWLQAILANEVQRKRMIAEWKKQ